VRSTAPEVNSGEGVTFLVREAAPKLKEAPGSTYGERGGVRWLGTDGAVENRGGCGGNGLRRRTRRGCGRDAEVASFYSRVLCRSNVGLHKDGEREVTDSARRQSGRTRARSKAQQRCRSGSGLAWRRHRGRLFVSCWLG
jgi:hypothetical protein